MKAANARPAWWQWPTILSLDAPAVALLWQWLIARASALTLPPPRPFVLAASVWLAYSADRWVEGWRLAPERIRTKRHHFYQRHRRPVALVWLIVFALDVAAACRGLDPSELRAGLLLLLAVLAYLLSHQLIHRDRRWRLPKEFCIAGLLAGGVAVFILPRAVWPQFRPALPALAGFLGLCFANCALISIWESSVDQSHGQTSWARQFAWGAALGRILPWVLAAAAVPFCSDGSAPGRAAAACIVASSLLLVAVDRAERRFGWEWARVAVDVALLTPVVPWLAAIVRS